jgi:hypothetical protein
MRSSYSLSPALARSASVSFCAGIVLAGTDFGGARRRLAALFAALSAEITGRFTGMLARAGPEMPETQPARQELVRRVIALDPVIELFWIMTEWPNGALAITFAAIGVLLLATSRPGLRGRRAFHDR